MGMFDYLNYEGHQYQTKGTPRQACDNYKIEDGVLWYEEYDSEWVDDEEGKKWLGGYLHQFNYRWIRCDDFTGKIRFYRSECNEENGKRVYIWIEYNALFKDGKMIHIRQVKEMEKVIRDGKVAVLYSPGWGAGWYTWHRMEELIYHPKIVELVENNRHEEITEAFIAELLGIIDEDDMPYISCVEDLVIAWLPVGTQFLIEEYDGNESITLKESQIWLTA